MKITVITGSPRKKGVTALLADELAKGAADAGHDVVRFDSAFEKVSPCNACDSCRTDNAECVYRDSMEGLYPKLIEADYVVFVTPLYYFGMSAQIKTVIDRFYGINSRLKESGKKSMLIAAAHDDNDWTMQALSEHYKTILKYLKWEDCGSLLAVGCGGREDAEAKGYSTMAYEMGNKI